MAVGEETSGAKMGSCLFNCIDEKPLTLCNNILNPQV